MSTVRSTKHLSLCLESVIDEGDYLSDDGIWRHESFNQLHADADFGYNKLGYDKNSHRSKRQHINSNSKQQQINNTTHQHLSRQSRIPGGASRIQQKGLSPTRNHSPVKAAESRPGGSTSRAHEIITDSHRSARRKPDVDTENNSYIKVKASPAKVADSEPDSRPSKPVRRTFSMPSHMHPPQVESRAYPRGYDQANNRLPSHHQSNNTKESQRPGRGVYSQSGQRIHVGTRRQIDGPTHRHPPPQDRPPKLPARNPSPPIRHGLRSQSTDRGGDYITAPVRRDPSSDRSTLTNEWARRHNGNPDWSYSSSESGQREKPIDQLRNRVRLAQQKQEQHDRLTPDQSQLATRGPDQSQPATRGRPRGKHVTPVASNIDFRNEQHRNSSSQHNNPYAKISNHGTVTSQTSRSPIGRVESPDQNNHIARAISPQSRCYNHHPIRTLSPDQGQFGFGNRVPTPDRNNRIPTPDRNNRVPTPDRNNRVPTPDRSNRVPTPERQSENYYDDRGMQPRRALSPERERTADTPPTPPFRTSSQGRVRALSPPKNHRHSSPLPEPSSTRPLSPSGEPVKPDHSNNSKPPVKPDRTFHNYTDPVPVINPPPKNNQYNRKSTAMDYSNEQPTVKTKSNSKHASSNKYKMLVCPDFFPVSKLNGLPGRRRSRGDLIVPEEFADPPVTHTRNDSIGGFYSQRTNQMQPVQPIMSMDDSFIEDPKEQILYPSTTLPNRRSRSKPKDTTDFYFEVNIPPSSPQPSDQPSDDLTCSSSDKGHYATIQSTSLTPPTSSLAPPTSGAGSQDRGNTGVATEGDSLFSLHSGSRQPSPGGVTGASPLSSDRSDGQGSDSRVPPKRLTQPPSYHQAVRRSFEHNPPSNPSPEGPRAKDKPQLRVEPQRTDQPIRDNELDNQYDRGVPHHSRRSQHIRAEPPQAKMVASQSIKTQQTRTNNTSDYPTQPSYQYDPSQSRNDRKDIQNSETNAMRTSYGQNQSRLAAQSQDRFRPQHDRSNLQQQQDGRGDQQLEISDEYLQYEQAETAGQRGQTAMVLAHIEPSESEEGSHYSTVHVYKTEKENKSKNKPYRGESAAGFNLTSEGISEPIWQTEQGQGRQSRYEQQHRKPGLMEGSRSRSTDRHPSNTMSNIPSSTQTMPPSTSQLLPTRATSIYSKISKPTVIPDRGHSTERQQSQHATTRPHNLHYRKQERSHDDDRLLEQIKAQSSPTGDNSRHPSYKAQDHSDGNVYENLANLQSPQNSPEYEDRASIHPVPHSENVHSIANHDYFYPPTIPSQSNPPKHQSNQSQNSYHYSKPQHGPPSSRKLHTEQSELRGPVHSSPRVASSAEQHASAQRQQNGQPRHKAVYFAEPAEAVYSNNEHVSDESDCESNSGHQDNGLRNRMNSNPPRGNQGNQYHDQPSQRSAWGSDGPLTAREAEITRLMQHLEADSSVLEEASQGLGEDILSITRMWKNLPAKDTWTEKRQALLDDPIMSAITEKMEAILKVSGEEKDKSHNPHRTLTVRNEAISPDRSESQGSPQSPSDVGLVTREPGEGSSDDLDESADLSLRKHSNNNQQRNKLPPNQSQIGSQRPIIVANSSTGPVRNNHTERPSRLFSKSQSRVPTSSQSGIPALSSKQTTPSRLATSVTGQSKPAYSRNSAPKAGLVAQYRQRFDSPTRTPSPKQSPTHTQSKPINQSYNSRQPSIAKSNQSQALRQSAGANQRDQRFGNKSKLQVTPASDDTQGMENLFKISKKAEKPASSRRQQHKPFTSTQEISESDDSMDDLDDEDINDPSGYADRHDENEDSDPPYIDESEVQYLSDYHRVKNRTSKSKAPSRKKISFSTDAQRSRPGDLIKPSQSDSLLSIDPFMQTTGSRLERTSSNTLLSMNPFMNDDDEEPSTPSIEVTSPSESMSSNKPGKLTGILKRSEDHMGSQVSLGTCSEFGGSHISLDSETSGISRAGSFPLLTMSDGSRKDFKITFNDTDVNDMGNLFKVARKARSEGAASEPESTDSESDDDSQPISCKNCHAKQPLFKARLIYKMCHGCYTYYCSSECRRMDWTAHKPLCIVSRLSSLARKIFKCVMSDGELLHHCSRFARTGYLCEGRGAVVLSFASPRKAQLFLSNAKQAKESALYLSVKDLQKFAFDDKRDKDQLLANCRHYNPDEKFVLHLAIKMNKSASNSQTIEPRIRGREFHKWARIRLSERHNNAHKGRVNDEDTLILTALSGGPNDAHHETPDHKMREVFFATVLTKLRKRGISLRHQYPDVYNALCQYVTTGKAFAPISLFAFNLHTQKRFMCCIMPYNDPDVTWGNNPHLMEDLDLAVSL